MNKLIIFQSLLLIFNCITSVELVAQKKNEGLAIAAGVIGSAVVGAIAIEEIKEQLESDAVDYILSNHPDISEFRIKCLFEPGTKFSDQSGSSVVVFKLTNLNTSIQDNERKILLRFNNDRYLNHNGLRVNKVEYVIFDTTQWNSIMAFFGNLMSSVDSIELSKSSNANTRFLVPLYTQSKCNNPSSISPKKYHLVDGVSEKCYIKSGSSITISNLTFMRYGFEYPDLNDFKKDPLFPFIKLKGDDYIVGDYSNDYKIFGNENTIGFYIKSMSKSILLKRTLVRQIHSFVNFHDIIYPSFNYEY